MLEALAVACGGALGALGRYWASGLIYKQFGAGFPYGTLGVNVLGSLAMGALWVMVHDRALPEVWRLAIGVGLLGAFTTFSTFSVDTLILAQQGLWLRAALNVALSVALCLAAAVAGAALARAV